MRGEAVTVFEQSQDRETRAMLSRVFDSAWEQLRVLHAQAAQPGNEQSAREELAKRIAEAHRNGERDPETLKLVALKAFDRWITEA
jgi:hypothetical protein